MAVFFFAPLIRVKGWEYLIACRLFESHPPDLKGYITMFFEKIKKHIDNASAVSFDVFDTLLLRPYAKPIDVFYHIENQTGEFGFATERIAAEMRTREKNPGREDINFDEIYDEIDDKFKHLKQTEIDWELQVLNQNPEMKRVWDYAKSKNKKIIIASDMYLPVNVIKKALIKNEFADYDYLYVSGELAKTKHFGTMYEHIISDINLKSSKILHIGDNYHSDYKRAKKLGIKAVHYEQILQQFQKHNPRAKKLLDTSRIPSDIGTGIILSVSAWRWKKNVWEL